MRAWIIVQSVRTRCNDPELICNSRVGGRTTPGLWSLLGRLSSLPDECLKNKVESDWGMTAEAVLWHPLHMCVYPHTNIQVPNLEDNSKPVHALKIQEELMSKFSEARGRQRTCCNHGRKD